MDEARLASRWWKEVPEGESGSAGSRCRHAAIWLRTRAAEEKVGFDSFTMATLAWMEHGRGTRVGCGWFLDGRQT